jgi:hypothetical protein
MGLPLCHVVWELCGISAEGDARVEKPKAPPLPPYVSLRLTRSAIDSATPVLVFT